MRTDSRTRTHAKTRERAAAAAGGGILHHRFFAWVRVGSRSVSLIGGCAAFALAGVAHSQARTNEVISEPVAIAPGFDAHMVIVNVPPAGDGPLTTAGQRGHRHPASTYAYVSKGAVISRLGEGAEKRFETGQGWSETPNQAHYLVNASRTEPAQLVVVQIAKTGTKTLTEPLPQ